MSTTLRIHPTSTVVPSFGGVLNIATARSCEYLRTYGIADRIELLVTLRAATEDRVVTPGRDASAWWSMHEYAWFQVSGFSGGLDAYSLELDDIELENIADLASEKPATQFARSRDRVVLAGRYWMLRKSALPSPLLTLAHGMLAGAFALLTEGFVDSDDDGAWDGTQLPAPAEAFLRTYLRPEATSDALKREEQATTIEQLRTILGPT